MSAPQLLYGHPRDNLLRLASAITVVTGAAESGYGTSKLFNSCWADPFKGTSGTISILIEFASPVLPDLAAILNSDLDVAGRLQGNDTTDFATPAIDVAFGVPVMNARGIFSSPHVSLSEEAPEAEPQANWLLKIVGNTRNVVIGEFYMGVRRALDGFVAGSVGFQLVGGTVTNPTYMGVPLSYEQVAGRKAASGAIVAIGSERAQIEDLVHAARFGARPFVLVPRSDVDDAWLVKITSNQIGQSPVAANADEVQLPIEMVSRGLPWVDPDDEA